MCLWCIQRNTVKRHVLFKRNHIWRFFFSDKLTLPLWFKGSIVKLSGPISTILPIWNPSVGCGAQTGFPSSILEGGYPLSPVSEKQINSHKRLRKHRSNTSFKSLYVHLNSQKHLCTYHRESPAPSMAYPLLTPQLRSKQRTTLGAGEK